MEKGGLDHVKFSDETAIDAVIFHPASGYADALFQMAEEAVTLQRRRAALKAKPFTEPATGAAPARAFEMLQQAAGPASARAAAKAKRTRKPKS